MVHIKKKKKLVRKLNIKGRRELFHSDTVFTKPATSILNILYPDNHIIWKKDKNK